MDKDFNWFVVYVFHDTVGYFLCYLVNFVFWFWVFCLGSGPVFYFVSLFSLDNEI